MDHSMLSVGGSWREVGVGGWVMSDGEEDGEKNGKTQSCGNERAKDTVSKSERVLPHNQQEVGFLAFSLSLVPAFTARPKNKACQLQTPFRSIIHPPTFPTWRSFQ
jgi:hypothetical protein